MFLIQSVIAVYVGAAVLPAVLLFWYIYKQDRYEKEPWPLLQSCFFSAYWQRWLLSFWKSWERICFLFLSLKITPTM